MFTVLHNNTEYPINLIRSADYDVMMNDIPELSMMVINGNNNPGYSFLQEEAVIVVKDHEWRIKAVSESTDYKNITALHIVMDLIDMPFNQLLNGTYTPRDLLTTILSGTGFTLDLDESGLSSVLLKDFGQKNPWKLLKEATDLLQAEFTVLPNRVIHVRQKLSSDKGQQLRYGYNLRNITKKSDSSDIVTHVIINYGEDYSQTAEFESPTAGNYDRAYYADIINDERITDLAGAQRRAERLFKDIDLSYEKDIARTGESYELGETVHTIYEPLNDLSITTRISKMSYEWNGEEFDLVSVTVGNYVFKTADEIYQDQSDKAINDTHEKIDETKEIINKTMSFKFQETEEKMFDQYTTVTTEYNAAITLSAREIRTDMAQNVQTINTAIGAQYNKITAEYNSSISQTAQQIRSEVSASVTSIGNDIQNVRNSVSSVTQTASLIESRVNSQEWTINNQGTRISSAESSISQQANQISQKVSYTDYTGSTITSLINQDPWAVSISAKKINLTGAIFVDGSISGATNISVTTDIQLGRMLQFSDMTAISTGGGNINIDAWNDLNYSAVRHRFYGIVDFSGATVVGLPK